MHILPYPTPQSPSEIIETLDKNETPLPFHITHPSEL